MLENNFIIVWPNKELRKKTKQIKKIDKKLIKEIKKIYFTLINNKFILGIAFNQININKKIFIAKLYDEKKKKEFIEVFINPKIIKKSKQKICSLESCLSIIGKNGIIYRNKSILLKYKNIKNKTKKKIFKNNNAICIQHEIDHLNGILWIDL